MATTNFVRPSWERFYELHDKNLTIFAQYTAAPWEYIGTQGVIQGTFETLRSVANVHLDGTWEGKILLCAGMGGMGGNQPRAMTMLGGVAVCADVDERIIANRLKVGYCDVVADSIPHALEMARKAADANEPLGIAVVANATELFEYALEHDFRPDVVTEMTPAHDPLTYVPIGHTVLEAEAYRKRDRDGYFAESRQAMVRQLKAMNRSSSRVVVRSAGPAPRATRPTWPVSTTCAWSSSATTTWSPAGSGWLASTCRSRHCPPASATSASPRSPDRASSCRAESIPPGSGGRRGGRRPGRSGARRAAVATFRR